MKSALNDLSRPLARPLTWGLLWGCVWLLLDTFAVVLRHKLQLNSDSTLGTNTWDIFGYVCLGAGFPLALGLFSELTAKIWRASWRTKTGATPSFDEFLWTRSDLTAGLSAALLTLALVSCSATFIGFLLTRKILSTIRTPSYAATAAALACTVSVVVVSALAPLLWRGLHKSLQSRWAQANARLFLPGSLTLLALTSLQAGALLLILRSDTWADAVAWVFVFAPALSLTLMISGGVPLHKKLPPVATRGLMLLLITLAILGATGSRVIESSLRRGLREPGIASSWAHFINQLTDFDQDGAKSLFGANDCSPFNALIYPGAADLPNNGIDEDCDGRDFHERPGSSLDVDFRKTTRPQKLRERPHILLITTDSLSASHTGMGGAKTNTTPELDAWAKRATVFSAGFSTSNATYASLPVLLTGAYPSAIPTLQKGVSTAPYFTDQNLLLPALLKALGYETIALFGDDYFDRDAWPSLADSFDVFSLDEFATAKAAEPSGAVHAAPELTKRAIAEIKKQRSRPLFLWVHYFDHHTPYTPRKEWITNLNLARTPSERFDQELFFADKHWGELFRAIESTYPPEDYVAVFTADHGEAFDENHPIDHHRYSLHSEELHVPFIIQTYAQRGQVYPELVSHLDLVPTFGALAQFHSALAWEGEDLTDTLFNGTSPQKKAIYSLFYSAERLRQDQDPFRQLGIRTDQHYLVSDLENRRQFLAEWRNDPLEKNNQKESLPEITGQLSYYLNRKLTELRRGHRAQLEGKRHHLSEFD